MQDLIARLEAAEGPSRELDLDIAEAVMDVLTGEQHRPDLLKALRDFQQREKRLPYDDISMYWLPHWTESMDATLKLLPKGDNGKRLCIVLEMYADGKANACVVLRTENIWSKEQATPALALLIAILKVHYLPTRDRV